MNTENTPITHKLKEYIGESTGPAVFARYEGLIAAAANNRFGALEDVVVVDTETTGVSYKHDELIQIAAARMSNGEIVDWYVTFVDPQKPIPEDIQHLTHIHPEDIEGAPTPTQAVHELAEFVGTTPLVAHNAGFDRHFITKHQTGAPLRSNIWIDSLDLARIAVPRLKSHRLLDLARAFGIEESTHRADDDVAATCQVYRILVAGVAAMPKDLVAAVADMATLEEWPTGHVFKELAQPVEVPFSLLSMRRDKVNGLVQPGKADAEALASNPETPLEYPTAQEIEEAFCASGLLGNAYENYEPRGEQVEMSKAVAHAFSTSTNLAVEAGTGVGKSMAYLVPAVMTAQRNNITVGVATKTNNLLDQLVNKELPLLDKVMGGVKFTALKGYSHYFCLNQVDRLLRNGPHMVETNAGEVHQAPALAAALSFIEQSEYDDLDTLKMDFRAVPRYMVTTASHECLKRKCPFFGKECFVHGVRRRAATADVVVTNHSLLFCDLAADGGLLPPIRYWVVDEAHGAENEGRRAFSLDLESNALLRTARKVASAEPSKNMFIRATRRFGNDPTATAASLMDVSRETTDVAINQLPADKSGQAGEGMQPLYHLTARALAAGKRYDQACGEFSKHIKDLLYFDQGKKNKSYERVELWVNEEVRANSRFKNLVNIGHELCESIEKLITATQEVVAFLEDVDGAAALQREIAAVTYELRSQLNAAEVILSSPSPVYAYAAELVRKRDRFTDSLSALMVNIGQRLNETLFASTHSVVFASATITVDGSFDAFSMALGLNESEESHTDYLQLDSCYDFDTNMTIYLPTDMPEPNDARYLSKLKELLILVHRAQDGSTLTLFTNRREMEDCYGTVRDALHEDDLRVVCQKWGVSIKGLRDDFLADEHLSLFALKSFWEGFDAPGATLKAVVVPKLPFKKPSDPLSCERGLIDANAWSHYVLPEAVLETKQAAGRLIRTADDTGSLILADHRLISKGYGKKFLRSMPSQNIKKLTMSEIAAELKAKREAE